jgi:flagellar hook-associated protein 3 FlgL
MVGPNNTVSVGGKGPAVIGSGSSDAFAMLSSISSVQRAQTAQTSATSSTTQLSSTEDVDPAQVAIQLTTANTAYQAALQTSASIRQLSLLDFLE